MEDKVYQVKAVRCTRPSSTHETVKTSTRIKSFTDDHRVKYHEEDPSQFQTAKARRPRRHTTGGPQQKDAIEKARQMIANDPDIDSTAHESSLGTLNRKQLVSLLKTRYGDDIEKYRSLKKKGAVDEVEHRNLVENGTAKRKKSHTILTYKTSGGVNGHVRRSSTSSQESSQTSQESLNPIASTRSEKTTNQVIRTTKVKQFGRTRKASDGSSVMSGYSSYGEEPHDQSTVTQRTVITRKIVKQPQKDNIIEAQQQRSREDELKELENLQRQQQVLVTERQSQASSQHQQQKQEVIDRDRVLFLQYKDEIKRVNMPKSISSLDTLKALFVTSFPGKLSMVRIDERGLIYIKDKDADIFYELEDLGDVKSRSHVQLREKTTSYDSLSSSQNDMTSFDNRHPPPYGYSTLPVRGRRTNERQEYAESLQDFQTRPRSGSGDSLRSDSVLTRPMRHYSQSAEKGPYVNSGFLSPRSAKKEIRVEERNTSNTRYEVKQNRMEQEVLRQPIKLAEPPKLKQQRKPSERENKGPTVEEQLADLTNLLHTAMQSDEEDSGYSERDRMPGKLNPDVIGNLVALSEQNYSKSPTKGSCYAPTALLEAKKREVEGPAEDLNFNYSSYTKTVEIPRQRSEEDTDKGYMHDGPNVYMKDSRMKETYESGLADSLLKSLQSPTSPSGPSNASSIRISASSSHQTHQAGHHQPHQVTSPPATPSRNPSSRIAVQTLKGMGSPTRSQEQQQSWASSTTTTTRTKVQDSPFQMDRMIGIASSAASLRNSILTLRSQLDELRLLHTNHSRNFKIFINQSLHDFNALAATVSQNERTGKSSGHSIRDRRFRVQDDYDSYMKRQNNTSTHLSRLEEETERLRRDVVQRKCVLETNHVHRLNSDLESLGKSLAELKSRFSGLHDMLKIVMAGELEIIVNEERFLKDEPGNLDNLYARCKHLSGTLLTLQRLASVQQMARSNEQQHQQLQHQDVNQNRIKVTVNHHSLCLVVMRVTFAGQQQRHPELYVLHLMVPVDTYKDGAI
ncbi:SRC kinase signaling inhibitor 1-like isoform X2 [Rhopilema esculentum]|uniref:SRC kinase signaling inhibitor 1-like isoform X2 n=1 Tax=Rhopilema esculentum TaxID=499914 RepID=UPI0031D2AB1F